MSLVAFWQLAKRGSFMIDCDFEVSLPRSTKPHAIRRERVKKMAVPIPVATQIFFQIIWPIDLNPEIGVQAVEKGHATKAFR